MRATPAAVCLAVIALCGLAVLESAAQPAYVLQRKQEQRNRVLKWCKENSVIIKGMTKDEVRKIYGRPDRRFNYVYEDEMVEMWKYNYPGHQRALFPFRPGPHASRWGTLYFKDDILVDVAR